MKGFLWITCYIYFLTSYPVLLEICDRTTTQEIVAAEKHLADVEGESDFEEDLAAVTGKKLNKSKDKQKIYDSENGNEDLNDDISEDLEETNDDLSGGDADEDEEASDDDGSEFDEGVSEIDSEGSSYSEGEAEG